MNEPIEVPETKAEPGPWETVSRALLAMLPPKRERVDGWAGHVLKQQEVADNHGARRSILLERLGRDVLIAIDPAFSAEETAAHVEGLLACAKDVQRVLDEDRRCARSYEDGWLHHAKEAGVPESVLAFERRVFSARTRLDSDPAFRRRLIDLECSEAEATEPSSVEPPRQGGTGGSGDGGTWGGR